MFGVLAATDGVDGYLARSRNEVTTFGKFLDPLADKLLVTAALLALVEMHVLPAWIALVIISREFIVSGLRMVASAEGTVIAASWYGKLKTVLQIVAILLFIVKDSSFIRGARPAGRSCGSRSSRGRVMGAAVVMTIMSMVDYFMHARDVLVGPWIGALVAGSRRRAPTEAADARPTRPSTRGAHDDRRRRPPRSSPSARSSTEGLRIDTNTAEIARELSRRGFSVAEAISVGDDADAARRARSRACAPTYALVVVTGGLGPTHDDVTREAAARGARPARCRPIPSSSRSSSRSSRATRIRAAASRCSRRRSCSTAPRCSTPTTGTAPGQIVPTPAGQLVLLPGPPREMRPMLARVLVSDSTPERAEPRELGVTGMSESDVQHAAQRALGGLRRHRAHRARQAR